MHTKIGHLVYAILLAFPVTVVGFVDDASALSSFSWRPGSIECEVAVASGGPKTVNDAVICAVNIKEISGACKNKGGNADGTSSHIFELTGSVIKTAGSSTWVKSKNGLQTNTIVITNEDILRIVDIWNAEHPGDLIDLVNGDCPNRNFTFQWVVTKADAVITQVKIPDPGSVAYKATTNCRPVPLPDGSSPIICDFDGTPFNDCNRANSKLEVKNSAGVLQTAKDFPINDCYLWRDVNRDPAFNLTAVYGYPNYDPDLAHIVAPQTGNVDGGDDDDLGGLVLVAPFEFYTGTCHQHAKENGNGDFQNLGPRKPDYNLDGTVVAGTGDAMCTGGSQLMDGTYP